MKSATIALVGTLLMASSVSAGFGMGGCPAVSSIAFNANMQTSRNHKLLYLDSSAYGYFNMAQKRVSSIPDIKCFDLGAFPYDSPTFDTLFVQTSSPTYTRLLYFDATTGTEVHYACMDYQRAISLVSYVTTTLGIPVPAWILNMGANLFRVLHFDGVMIMSN